MDTLAAAYERCRQVHRRCGRSYYLATRLLPAWKRRHVHALYGFTRIADDIVDGTGALPAGERARRLEAWSAAFLTGLAPATGAPGPAAGNPELVPPDDAALLVAVRHTIRVFGLDLGDFRTFLESMAMDLTVTRYQTYQDLLGYMAGSAAAIGTMMLPILQAGDTPLGGGGAAGRGDPASGPARELGLAFQLTNFIRDVAEDLDRGRIYLPAEDLDRFGLDGDDLAAARAGGGTTPALRALIRFEVQRARGHYASASRGIAMLKPSSRPCIAAAFRIYGAILDEIELQGYDVFARRAVVPATRRVRLLTGAVFAAAASLPRAANR